MCFGEQQFSLCVYVYMVHIRQRWEDVGFVPVCVCVHTTLARQRSEDGGLDSSCICMYMMDLRQGWDHGGFGSFCICVCDDVHQRWDDGDLHIYTCTYHTYYFTGRELQQEEEASPIVQELGLLLASALSWCAQALSYMRGHCFE